MTENDQKRVLAAVDFGTRHYQRVLLGLPFGIGTRRRGYYPHSGLVVGTIKQQCIVETVIDSIYHGLHDCIYFF